MILKRSWRYEQWKDDQTKILYVPIIVGFWAFKDKNRWIRECGLNGTRFRGDAIMDTDKIRIWPWGWEAEAEQRTRSLEEKRARDWEVRMLQDHPCGHWNDQALWEVGLEREMVSQHLNLQRMTQSDLGWGRWSVSDFNKECLQVR